MHSDSLCSRHSNPDSYNAGVSGAFHECPFRDRINIHIESQTESKKDTVPEQLFYGLRTAAAISLLRDHPDIIVPKPLSADEPRYEVTGDPKLIDKAKRRGCFQFDVGRHVVACPGVRRPHFSMRYMGRVPDLKPALRPIKGCIVKRQVVRSVPQGYLDDEENETGGGV